MELADSSLLLIAAFESQHYEYAKSQQERSGLLAISLDMSESVTLRAEV